MEKKHEVHNLIILDESGSMNSIKNHVISGLNEIVQTIKGIEKKFPEQEHYITFLTFNGFGIKQLHFADRARELKKINSQTYNPEADTPLYDCLLYTSDAADDLLCVDLGGRRIIKKKKNIIKP